MSVGRRGGQAGSRALPLPKHPSNHWGLRQKLLPELTLGVKCQTHLHTCINSFNCPLAILVPACFNQCNSISGVLIAGTAMPDVRETFDCVSSLDTQPTAQRVGRESFDV